MHLGVGVEAGVGENGQLVVEVGGLPEGGQHHAAGGDAGQDEPAQPGDGAYQLVGMGMPSL